MAIVPKVRQHTVLYLDFLSKYIGSWIEPRGMFYHMNRKKSMIDTQQEQRLLLYRWCFWKLDSISSSGSGMDTLSCSTRSLLLVKLLSFLTCMPTYKIALRDLLVSAES